MKELYDYLKEWNKWRLKGAPNLKPFSRSCGLCTNAREVKNGSYKLYWTRKEQLKKALIADDLNPEYPFGWANYDGRAYNATQHLDPNRIAWVEEFIRKYEEAERKSPNYQLAWDMEYPTQIEDPGKGHKF